MCKLRNVRKAILSFVCKIAIKSKYACDNSMTTGKNHAKIHQTPFVSLNMTPSVYQFFGLMRHPEECILTFFADPSPNRVI